jgi:RNA polymerase sigma-70 factor (ECF subfamily)
MDKNSCFKENPILLRDLLFDEAKYNELWKRLYFFALKKLSNPQDAEDAVQETYYKALKIEITFNSLQNAFSYLHKIHLNNIFDILSKSKREPVSFEEMYETIVQKITDEPGVDVKFQFNNTIDLLKNLIDELPEKDKEILLLSMDPNIDQRMAAKRVNKSYGSYREHLCRVRNKLRKMIRLHSH